MDESYIRVKGEDKSLYRAIDSRGQTIDFLLTARRDTAAAKRFLRKAIDAIATRCPGDKRGQKPSISSCGGALKREGAIPSRIALRRCKYINNVIEQDHRTIKK